MFETPEFEVPKWITVVDHWEGMYFRGKRHWNVCSICNSGYEVTLQSRKKALECLKLPNAESPEVDHSRRS
jgi:hypothetical protein